MLTLYHKHYMPVGKYFKDKDSFKTVYNYASVGDAVSLYKYVNEFGVNSVRIYDMY